jgi:hypothetical protein
MVEPLRGFVRNREFAMIPSATFEYVRGHVNLIGKRVEAMGRRVLEETNSNLQSDVEDCIAIGLSLFDRISKKYEQMEELTRREPDNKDFAATLRACAAMGNEWLVSHERLRTTLDFLESTDTPVEGVVQFRRALQDAERFRETPGLVSEKRFRVSPLAYLRACWSLLWTALLHPRTTSVISLRTGRVLKT